jgi:hypothetical protein
MLGGMRRTLLICMLLVATLLPAPAQADSTVIVRETDNMGFGPSVFSCSANPFAVGQIPGFLIQKGPGTVPAGTRSWGFDGSGGDGMGPYALPTDPMKDLSVAEASFYSLNVESGVAIAIYQEPADESNGEVWFATANIGLSGGQLGNWTTISGIGLSYNWTKYQPGQNGYEPTGDPSVASTTVGTFADAHGTSGLGGYALVMGCGGSQINFDKFRIGTTGSVTTYDFEAELTTLTMKTASTTIRAGQSKTIGGSLSPLFQTAHVRLEAKKFNATSWSLVGTGITGEQGEPFSLTVKPLVQTSYRWRFIETDAALGSTSKTITIKVRMVVTAAPVAKVVNLGKLITIKGKVKPAKPGHLVTLWRKTATGKVKLKTAIIKADGSYAVSIKASKTGTFKYLVTVPAQSGNLAGTSPVVSVSVVR